MAIVRVGVSSEICTLTCVGGVAIFCVGGIAALESGSTVIGFEDFHLRMVLICTSILKFRFIQKHNFI